MWGIGGGGFCYWFGGHWGRLGGLLWAWGVLCLVWGGIWGSLCFGGHWEGFSLLVGGGGGAFLVVWAYLGLTWRGGLNPGLGGSLGVWGHRGGSPGFWESLRSLGGLWVPMEPSLPPLVPPQVRGGADLGRGGRCAGG